MEYTAPTPISRGLAVLCPSLPIIASANGNVLQLHHVHSNSLLSTLTTAAPITHIVWSLSHDDGHDNENDNDKKMSKSATNLNSEKNNGNDNNNNNNERDSDNNSEDDNEQVDFCKEPLLAVASRGGDIVVTTANGVALVDIHDGQLEIAWLALSQRRLIIGYEHSFGVSIYEIDEYTPSILLFIPYAMRPPPLPSCSAAARIISPCGRFIALVLRDGRSTTNATDSLLIIALRDASVAARVCTPAGISNVLGIRWAGSSILIWGRTQIIARVHSAALMSVRGKVIFNDVCQYERRLVQQNQKRSSHSSDDGVQHMMKGENESRLKSKSKTRLEVHEHVGESGRICTTTVANCSSKRIRGMKEEGATKKQLKKQTANLAILSGYNGSIDIVNINYGIVCKRLSHHAPEADATCAPLVFRERRERNRSVFDKVKWAAELEIGGTRAMTTMDRHAVGWMEVSGDGSLLASRDVSAKHLVLIWDLRTLRLAVVLILKEAVVCAKWNNNNHDTNDNDGNNNKLAMSCGGGFVYVWERRGAAAVEVSCREDWGRELTVRRVAWSCDDEALLLVDGVTARAFITMYVN